VAETRQTKHKVDPDGPIPGQGLSRMCAVTRAELPPGALIRFVRSPTGELVPDLDMRLPGRGVWVTCDRKIVEKAIKTKAFARSLQTDVSLPADLAERLDSMLLRRASDALALANKAGMVVSGFQQVDAALEKGQVAVLLHGADAADDGRRKLDRKFKAIQREREAESPISGILTIAQMSLAIGRPSVVHAALLPGGLATRFQREAERVLRYRSASGAEQHSGDDIATPIASAEIATTTESENEG
jgi:predicted RNA-binding protein YlxR (DUF448 family)